jgi:hypothetical protein
MKSDQPAWQKISGLNPATEQDLPADQRDAGIRKLVAEVDRIARAEFARGDSVPKGERTLFWDPLARICALLAISRTKLSAYSRELTGMRAHEITDRIKAESLPAQLSAWIERLLEPQFISLLRQQTKLMRETSRLNPDVENFFRNFVKAQRSGLARASFAASLGYANPSRLNRACLLAHGMSLDELEAKLLDPIVQKFSDKLIEAQSAAKQAREASPVSPLTEGD